MSRLFAAAAAVLLLSILFAVSAVKATSSTSSSNPGAPPQIYCGVNKGSMSNAIEFKPNTWMLQLLGTVMLSNQTYFILHNQKVSHTGVVLFSIQFQDNTTTNSVYSYIAGNSTAKNLLSISEWKWYTSEMFGKRTYAGPLTVAVIITIVVVTLFIACFIYGIVKYSRAGTGYSENEDYLSPKTTAALSQANEGNAEASGFANREPPREETTTTQFSLQASSTSPKEGEGETYNSTGESNVKIVASPMSPTAAEQQSKQDEQDLDDL